VFDRTKLHEAHAQCLRSFVRNVMAENSIYTEIVVDNTNTTQREVTPYAALALAYGHALKIVTLIAVDEATLATCMRRNLHEVPSDTIRAQNERVRQSLGKFPKEWKEQIIHVSAD
jgi:hypothetical protein